MLVKVLATTPNLNQAAALMHDASPLDRFWTGFRLAQSQSLSEHELLLRLEPEPLTLPRCGRCCAPCALVHERRVRRVRERDLLDQRVWLEVPLRRVECLRCGVSTEYVPWLPRRSRLTARLISHVEALVRLLPIRHVCELTGLHWGTIKRIDRARLARELGPPDLASLRRHTAGAVDRRGS